MRASFPILLSNDFTKVTVASDFLKVFGKAASGITEEFSYINLYKIMQDNPNKFIKTASEKPETIQVKALLIYLS